MMEGENKVLDETQEKADSHTDEMAPQDSEGVVSDSDMGLNEQKENKDPMLMNNKIEDAQDGPNEIEKKVEQMTMPANETDEGELGEEAEDGEILEDGEIASDNDDGEVNDDEKEESEEIQSPSKTGASKSRGSGHREDHKRRGHDRRERHSKRRRTSKEDSHKEKQKKKRHKDYSEYDKTGEDYDSAWTDTRREKGDRKRDHSPGHDSHGEERRKHDKDSEKHRRGSGENRHHSSREKERGRDRNTSEKEKTRDRDHEKHDWEKSEKKDRDRRGRDVKDVNYDYSDDHESSPPGIYDSPSDDEFDASRYAEKKPKFEEEEEYPGMDPEQQMMKGKRKPPKKFDRRRPREAGEFEEEPPPAKKKPLLQTPMEERPVCRFFKEGKCQKGQDCPFNHDYQPQRRLELCKYHLQSYCRKEGCMFMHEDFPCKYFHTGSTCYQGDKCKFSHEPLTEETDMALKNLLKDKEIFKEEEFVERKHKKKGLLGDQPAMSDEQIQRKLHTMKSIPSIFDIQTHRPNENANKPPGNMGQAPNMGPQGPFQDNGMPPQGGPNMRFPGPPNQVNTQVRPPFLGPAQPGMEVPSMGIQGPPMNGPMVSGPGMMGPGSAPMMSTPGMQGPGVQGNPMGPPMSQAAALVGAILRAAPMLQGYRGPGPQGANNNMPNNMQGDPRFMGPNMMGVGQNIENQNMMVPPPNMGGQMMSPGQENMMGDANQGLLGTAPNAMNKGQDLNMQQMQMLNAPTVAGNVRDPRKSGAQNDPRLNKGGDSDMSDIDMRPGQISVGGNLGDEDLRQDVDMRKEEASSNQGDHTPQQDWDDENMDISNDDDDMEIPNHLPPKQREMFLRIKQHTMKMKREKSQQQKQSEQQNNDNSMKIDDDKWYSSDDEDDIKPSIPTMPTSTSQADMQNAEGKSANASSSIDVMQMINAIKSSNSTTNVTTSRPLDPRKQLVHVKPVIPAREPAMIYSRDGDCPWRLCRVMYVKDKIPDHVDLNDEKYKSDPRVQKMVKLHEFESGQVIDHTKSTSTLKSENQKVDAKLPNLLDPKMFQDKQGGSSRPELAPFVDPRSGKPDNVVQHTIPDVMPPKPMDPRLKAAADPRVQRMLSNPGNNMPSLPSRPSDPRLSRQDSSSSTVIAPLPRIDPRLARQNSQDLKPSKISTPTPVNRQSSIPEPKITALDSLPRLPIDLGLGLGGASDPRLTKTVDSDSSYPLQRQSSQTGSNSDRDSSGDSPKPKLDYRNDPRFKRKRIAEPSGSPDSQGKRLMGQRKTSTEYSSPLDRELAKPEESGYNSYNRPRPAVKPTTQSQNSNVPKADTSTGASPDLTTQEILDSIQIMPPPSIETPQNTDKNLKDIFKTIDPTASPFC